MSGLAGSRTPDADGLLVFSLVAPDLLAGKPERGRDLALLDVLLARFEDRAAELSQYVQVRFVYEHELKGDWFRVVDALNVPVYPHPDYRVIRVEFRDHKAPDEGHTPA